MHPKKLDKLRTFIAKRSLITLIFSYVVVVALFSVTFGLIFYFLSDIPDNKIHLWIIYTFLQLFSSDLPNSSLVITPCLLSIFIVVKILSIVLPTLFLGSIVFKIFIVPKVLVFRKKCLIYYSKKRSSYVIAFRFYSATELMIYSLNISAVARINMESPRSNSGFISNEALTLDKSFFPTLSSRNPFTIIIPLYKGDVLIEDNDKKLISVQGHSFKRGARITLLLNGAIPELGVSLVEKYSYSLPQQIEWQMFKHFNIKKKVEWVDFET